MDDVAAYICLGDSMSIDTYPYYELSQINPAVTQSVGAGSLLYKNVTSLWPEFDKTDISTAFPKAAFVNLASDGATTFDFLGPDYLEFLNLYTSKFVVVTMTLTGNDLLQLIAMNRAQSSLSAEVEQVLDRYNLVLEQLQNFLPRAVLILGTIYDPTDGTGQLSGFGDIKERLPYLLEMNEGIKDSARKRGALVADIYSHFLGRGMNAPASERWYWTSPIEPSARGASEIRRLWLNALNEVGILKS